MLPTNSRILRYGLGIAVFLFLLPALHLDQTPSGDGGRTVPYLEAINTFGGGLPSWNPNKFGGIPLLADPHSFFWLAGITYFSPSLIEVQVNLLLVLSLVLIALSGRYLLQQLGCQNVFAAAGGFLIGVSQLSLVHLGNGTITILYCYGFMLLVAGLLIADAKAPNLARLAVISILIGIIGVGRMHYALPFLVLAVFLIVCIPENPSKPQSTAFVASRFTRLMRFAIAGVLGFGMQFIFLFQMGMYNLGEAGDYSDRWFYPFETSSLLALFVPIHASNRALDTWSVYPFLGLSTLVACGLYIVFRKDLQKDRLIRFWGLVFIVNCVCLFLQELIFSLSFMDYARDHIPVLGRMRQPIEFMWLVVMSGVITTFLIFSQLEKQAPIKPGKTWRFYALVFAVPFVSLVIYLNWLGYGGSDMQPAIVQRALWVGSLQAVFWLCVAIAGLYAFLHDRLTLTQIAILACVVQIVLFLPRIGASTFNDREMNVDNEPQLPEAYQILRNDTDYFRVGCVHTRIGCDHSGIQDVPGLSGFSMLFPAEHRAVISWLTGQWPTKERAHWVPRIHCEAYNQEVVTLLKLKYLICRNNNPPLAGWTRLTEEKTGPRADWEMWRQDAWDNRLSIFTTWSAQEGGPPTFEALQAALKTGTILIDKADLPAHSEQSQTAIIKVNAEIERPLSNTLEIEIDAPIAGLLAVPEYWDRGWSATVNGEVVPVMRGYGVLRVVQVQKGLNKIALEYTPPYWHQTFIVTVVSWALTLILLLVGLVRLFRSRDLEPAKMDS